MSRQADRPTEPNPSLSAEVTLDDREQASGLPQAIERVTGQKPLIRRLAIGDIAVGQRLLIERKTSRDFIDSLLEGRLEQQLTHLMKAHTLPLLIIEGMFNTDIIKGLSAHEIRRTFLMIQLDRRITLLRSKNVTDTAQWVGTLARHEAPGGRAYSPAFAPVRTSRGPTPHLVTHTRPPKPSSPERVPMTALKKVPGLGQYKVLSLLQRFGSLSGILSASEDELAAVEGIGPTLARAIKQKLQRGG